MVVECESTARAVASTNGCWTMSRNFTDRAIRPPVRRVRRPVKSSSPDRRFFDERRKFFAHLIHDSGRNEVVDHDDTVLRENGLNDIDVGVGGHVTDRHGSLR